MSVSSIRRFTPRTFWTVSLAAAVVLGAIVAIPQLLSKHARLEVLRSNVGAIARLAASVVDGDLHRQLLDPANKTPELYARTVEPLVRFHAVAEHVAAHTPAPMPCSRSARTSWLQRALSSA